MLISKSDIIKYLKEIPPVPESVKACLDYLKQGELKKAALEADKDIVLKKQIESIVNSAAFSLPNKVEDTVQLFSMIGLEMAKSLVYSYLVKLLSPKEWKIFDINFADFQAAFMKMYEENMILEFGEDVYKKYAEIGAIVPAAVCVCDSLLGDKKEDLELILDAAPLEYGTLLKRMTGASLFGLAAKIAEIWGLEKEKTESLKKAECDVCDNEIAALIHFIFFYLSSKKQFLDLNSLIEFKPESIEKIPKTYERIINGS
ncbi:HDOD domain-containing protein [Caminibacter pacificus]|uniref:HDOD domain-containing protein n=1 Tax=Caminibacter pacificus TaxID=1424653 RepID=A0AAJ4RBF9_9BACT|nr:HDOD domain-containing protein [Caminibacter pacificus]NPA87892.1 HDOD domain-containing protein [Campylobacterota bacterium]QCI27488.1 HDOD domain-containing protein [Caminibacter pacificus]ROR38927.1 HDOD domain-containing protein [Caminibacter pacificus]